MSGAIEPKSKRRLLSHPHSNQQQASERLFFLYPVLLYKKKNKILSRRLSGVRLLREQQMTPITFLKTLERFLTVLPVDSSALHFSSRGTNGHQVSAQLRRRLPNGY